MNQQEYEQICTECDQVLCEEGLDSVGVMAISYLHVLNEHPIHTSKYIVPSSPTLFAVLRFFIDGFARIITSVFVFYRIYQFSPKVKSDVLVLSHLLNAAQLKQESDFYFGELLQILKSKEITNALALINHSANLSRKAFCDSSFSQPKFIFSRILSPCDELLIKLEQWQAYSRLREISAERSAPRLLKIANESLAPSTAANLRLYRQTLCLIRKIQPKAVVLTYEGHAWERLVFHASRQVLPNITCIAYQHTAIFPKQHAIRRSLGPLYDPDIVVFAGSTGQNWFLESADFHPKTQVVGTPRYDSQIQDLNTKLDLANACPSCLLVPDGTLQECLLFASFGLVCSQLMPQVRFVMRLHPVISWSVICNQDNRLKCLPDNFVISNKPIESDFVDNFWVIYRGSGAGIRGASVGLRPLYLNSPSSGSNINLLCFLDSWMRVVSTPKDVQSIIVEDLSNSGVAIRDEFLSALPFMRSIFSQYDPGVFVDIITASFCASS